MTIVIIAILFPIVACILATITTEITTAMENREYKKLWADMEKDEEKLYLEAKAKQDLKDAQTNE